MQTDCNCVEGRLRRRLMKFGEPNVRKIVEGGFVGLGRGAKGGAQARQRPIKFSREFCAVSVPEQPPWSPPARQNTTSYRANLHLYGQRMSLFSVFSFPRLSIALSQVRFSSLAFSLHCPEEWNLPRQDSRVPGNSERSSDQLLLRISSPQATLDPIRQGCQSSIEFCHNACTQHSISTMCLAITSLHSA